MLFIRADLHREGWFSRPLSRPDTNGPAQAPPAAQVGDSDSAVLVPGEIETEGSG
jgi:hypothetical protein